MKKYCFFFNIRTHISDINTKGILINKIPGAKHRNPKKPEIKHLFGRCDDYIGHRVPRISPKHLIMKLERGIEGFYFIYSSIPCIHTPYSNRHLSEQQLQQ